jgi:hypothetical protein
VTGSLTATGRTGAGDGYHFARGPGPAEPRRILRVGGLPDGSAEQIADAVGEGESDGTTDDNA